jgi:large subunit ribosomal protein L17
MKHGIKLRKLQGTPSHRWALLRYAISFTEKKYELTGRNLVSALLHHETIKTTLPKAKEAARMAEKVCPALSIWVGS